VVVKLITAKTILTPSKLPGSDWSINPYQGCSFGCVYCYASFIGRWKHPEEKWGEFVDIKINAAEVLKEELEKYEKKYKSKNFGTIFFSSVTDPYQGVEAKYKITRQCLEVLADFGYEGLICIQTKSPLIIRDLDIIKKLKKCEAGMTITSLDDSLSKFLEVRAPLVTNRIKVLGELAKEGVNTYAFVGPILPYILASKADFLKLIKALENAKVKKVWFEGINLSNNIRERLYGFLRKNRPELIIYFDKTKSNYYRKEIDKMIDECLKGSKLTIEGNGVIWHGKV
jgi:DNA repair photolyase